MGFYGHRVREFMRRELVTCRPTTPLETLIARSAVSAGDMLVVADDDGYALGLVSRNDIMLAQRSSSQSTGEAVTAGAIMKAPIQTCEPDALLRDVVTVMYCQRVDHLLVIKPGEDRLYPMGMLCMGDIILRLVQETPPRGIRVPNRRVQWS